MEDKIINEDIGNIKISEEVVAILADKAIKEVDGIAGLSGSFVDSFAVVLGKKTGLKGIGVDIKNDVAIISLHTIVKYGFRIPEVAWQAQEVVKNTVESMTGLTVCKVNISVEGVEFPSDEIKVAEDEYCDTCNSGAKEKDVIQEEVIEEVDDEICDCEDNGDDE